MSLFKRSFLILIFLVSFYEPVRAESTPESDPWTYWGFKNVAVDFDQVINELELPFQFDTCELTWKDYPEDREFYYGLGPCLYRKFWAYDNRDDATPFIKTKGTRTNGESFELEINWMPITFTGLYDSYFNEDATGISTQLNVKLVNSPSFSHLFAASLKEYSSSQTAGVKLAIEHLIQEIESLNFDEFYIQFIPMKKVADSHESDNEQENKLALLKMGFLGQGKEIYQLSFKTNFSLGAEEFFLESVE